MTRCALTVVLMALAGPVYAGQAKGYEALDGHALKAPPEAEKSLAKLAEYLGKPCKTGKDKARVIYRWITDRIAYNAEALFSGKLGDKSPEGVLKNRKAVCEGFMNLYFDLSDRLGLKAFKVVGFSKPIDAAVATYAGRPNHGWIAVHFDEKWWLVDPTWGAGMIKGKEFVKEFREFYFLAPPDQLIFSHFPQDSKWQLLEKPILQEQFNRQPKISHQFWRLGVTSSAVRAQLEDKTVKGLVYVFNWTGPAVELVKAPLRKNLEAGKEYQFHFKSEGLDSMSVLHNGTTHYFEKTGNDFELTIHVNKGRLVVGGRSAGDKSNSGLLDYDVE
jgi:hypothetical protein